MKNPLGLNLIPLIKRLPTAMQQKIAAASEGYRHISGYRQVGLKADDIIDSENHLVELALTRLTPREAYDRAFRLRRAVQCDINHIQLPKEEWTKPEDDVHYLTPHLEQIVADMKEKEQWDNITVVPKK